MNQAGHMGAGAARPRPAKVRSQRRGTHEEGLGQGGAGQTQGAHWPLRCCWCPAPEGCPSEPRPASPPTPRLPAQRASPGCWGKSGGRGADHWVCPKPPLQLRKAKVKLKLVHKPRSTPTIDCATGVRAHWYAPAHLDGEAVWPAPLPISLDPLPQIQSCAHSAWHPEYPAKGWGN